jgi:hypothetical protein
MQAKSTLQANSRPQLPIGATPVRQTSLITTGLLWGMFETSYGPDRSTYLENRQLAHYLNCGAIEVHQFPYEWVTPRDGVDLRMSQHCGGFAHGELKYQALRWLKRLGGKDAAYEQRWSHGRADVCSSMLGIAVECGSTCSGKVLASLLDPDTRAFVLFPVLDLNETPSAFWFSRGELFELAALPYLCW